MLFMMSNLRRELSKFMKLCWRTSIPAEYAGRTYNLVVNVSIVKHRKDEDKGKHLAKTENHSVYKTDKVIRFIKGNIVGFIELVLSH